MASAVIRTTYALDTATVEQLDRLAAGWRLSRSAALRKLIREAGKAAAQSAPPDPRLAALDQLQAGNQLSRREIDAWLREVRLMRRAGTLRGIAKAQPRR